MNNRLAFIQTFFNGAFEAYQTQFIHDEQEQLVFELAFNLTIKKYSNQPIYRDSIIEFKEWFKQLTDEKSR